MSGDTIRVYLGTEDKTSIACGVLQDSITRRTQSKVEFVRMIGKAWEYDIAGIPVGTGFSLRRWLIPAACGWKGYAIYLDADQLVFGDIRELWDLGIEAIRKNKSMAATTWQTDKHFRTPAPQSSVMVIDCAAAAVGPASWGWKLDQILAHLRRKDGDPKARYAEFMHALWMDPRPAILPKAWNHLNVYKADVTRLLHYTKEPEQPWYMPSHPLANHWRDALIHALRSGAVPADELERGLAQWGKTAEVDGSRDWRRTNGLHPDYAHFGKFATDPDGDTPPPARVKAKAALPRKPSVGATNRNLGIEATWVTSFGPRIIDSGMDLVESFLGRKIAGKLFIALDPGSEYADLRRLAAARPDRLVLADISESQFLTKWRRDNAFRIPTEFGGESTAECKCAGGPYARHDRKHAGGCVASWWCYHASRWAVKPAALEMALAALPETTHMVWIDADCRFRAGMEARHLSSVFGGKDCFYLKSRRPVLEAGLFGFRTTPGGKSIFKAFFDKYALGGCFDLPRWDDSYQLQIVLDTTRAATVDVARTVTGHSEVVPNSAMGPYVLHAKGSHSRIKGIFS